MYAIVRKHVFLADVSNALFQANVMDGPVNPLFFLSLSLFFSNHDQTQQTLQGVGSLSLCFNVLIFKKKKKNLNLVLRKAVHVTH